MHDLLLRLGGDAIILGALGFILQMWMKSRLDHALSKALEDYRQNLKVREQASKVAEYLALIKDDLKDATPEDFRKANRLNWELAIYLPTEIYKDLAQAIINRSMTKNEFLVIEQVRKHLLGTQAGELSAKDILVHGPYINRPHSVAPPSPR